MLTAESLKFLRNPRNARWRIVDGREDDLRNHLRAIEAAVRAEAATREAALREALLKAGRTCHVAHHSGPWPTCGNLACEQVRAALSPSSEGET